MYSSRRCTKTNKQPNLSSFFPGLLSYLLTKIAANLLLPSLHSLTAMSHPRCVAWGEIGLDYHYDNSPRPLQQSVLRRQLLHAVKLEMPIVIHTREAEEDTEAILKECVPREHRVRSRSRFWLIGRKRLIGECGDRYMCIVIRTLPSSPSASSSISRTSI